VLVTNVTIMEYGSWTGSSNHARRTVFLQP